MLVDTHAHLYWDSFEDDLDEVIRRSLNAGVTIVINVGVDVEKSKEAAQVSKKLTLSACGERTRGEPGVKGYSSIGIHPHESIKYSDAISIRSDIKKLEQIYLSDTSGVVAVGECGLDYYFDPKFTPSTLSINQIKKLQRKLFKAQIELAKKLNLPLLVHCRDDRSKNPNNTEAWDEVLKLIGNHPAILHCYSGLPQTTNYILQTTNLLISFAANITYPKNEYLREAVKALPLERICLETDCPFLAPQSKRGQRNEPANVLEIAQLIADVKEVSLEEVAKQTTTNAGEILRLGEV